MRKLFASTMGSMVALAGFAGMANASATVDLVWIDVSGTDTAGKAICLRPANRNCPQLGSTISSVVVTDSITLGVILTAGPGSILGAGVDIDYNDAQAGLSVSAFRNLMTTPYLTTTLADANADTDGWVQLISAMAFPFANVGIGLEAGATAYLGTVTFHNDLDINGTFEIAVGVDGPDGLSDVLRLDGTVISDSTTFNSASLVNPTPTATPTPLCTPAGASCRNNADCCSNQCSGPGGNKICQPGPTPTASPTPTPEPSSLTALGSGIAMLALLYRRRASA